MFVKLGRDCLKNYRATSRPTRTSAVFAIFDCLSDSRWAWLLYPDEMYPDYAILNKDCMLKLWPAASWFQCFVSSPSHSHSGLHDDTYIFWLYVGRTVMGLETVSWLQSLKPPGAMILPAAVYCCQLLSPVVYVLYNQLFTPVPNHLDKSS